MSGVFVVGTRYGFLRNLQTGNCAHDVRSAHTFATWQEADDTARKLSKKGVFGYWLTLGSDCGTMNSPAPQPSK